MIVELESRRVLDYLSHGKGNATQQELSEVTVQSFKTMNAYCFGAKTSMSSESARFDREACVRLAHMALLWGGHGTSGL
jgi:hypothetical protein